MSVGRGNLLAFVDAAEASQSIFAFLQGSLPDASQDSLQAALQNYFERNGFDAEVSWQQECLDPLIENHLPELIILPLLAENFDSLELLKNIVSRQPHPAVLVAGQGSQVDLVAPLIQAGAAEYFLSAGLGSEAETELLLLLIDKTIASHRSQLALAESEAKLKHALAVAVSDQSAGFDVQQKLLPDSPQMIDGLNFAYLLKPCQGMSGDSANCMALPDGKILFYLADVSGHGAPGGMVSTALTIMSHRLVSGEIDVARKTSGEILGWFNQELLRLRLDQHITMFLGLIDKTRRILEYSSAAHFPGTILKQSNSAQFLQLGSLPLGICETSYDSQQANLDENFEIISFSDGVLEILPQETLKDRESHLLSLVESAASDIGTLASHLALNKRSSVPDDIAILTLSRVS